MTPALKQIKQAKIAYHIHEYAHDPSSRSYGLEAAEKMQVSPDRVYKTLIVKLNTGALVAAVIPVNKMLNLKHLAKAASSKKAAMAEGVEAERSTGYVLGGVSPLGQKKRLQTFIEENAEHYPTIFISAGRRGAEIELDPKDLLQLTRGATAPLCQ